MVQWQYKNERWHLNGSTHRVDAPAIIEYHESGGIQSIHWFINDNLHRVDAPAITEYHISGKIEEEQWYLNGQLHRIDGPAYILYHQSGNIHSSYWYLNGKESNHKEWLLEHNLYNKPYNTWADEGKVLWRLTWI